MLKIKIEYELNNNELEELLEWHNQLEEKKLTLEEYIELLKRTPDCVAEYCEEYNSPTSIDIECCGQHDKRWWENE